MKSKITSMKSVVLKVTLYVSLICTINVAYAQTAGTTVPRPSDFVYISTHIPTHTDIYPVEHHDNNSGWRFGTHDPGTGFDTSLGIDLNGKNNTWNRVIDMKSWHSGSYNKVALGVPAQHTIIGRSANLTDMSTISVNERLTVFGNANIHGSTSIHGDISTHEVRASSLYVDAGTDFIKLLPARTGHNENSHFEWGDDAADTLIFEQQIYNGSAKEVLSLHNELIKTNVQKITFDYGTTTDLTQVSVNTPVKVNHAALTVAGGLYVGPRADLAANGQLARFQASYLDDFKLWVEDGIITERYGVSSVEAGQWRDMVFESDYALPSLDDVSNFIGEHGHLKDVPSATDVEENGYDLVDMDATLLQKIEELMLYTLEQKRQIEDLQDKILMLKEQKVDKAN